MIQVIADEGCLKDLTPVERVLGERCIVDLGALATDPRWQELFFVLRGATFITKVLDYAVFVRLVVVLVIIVEDQSAIFLVQHLLLMIQMHHWIPAIRSVSCVPSPLPALAILSILLARRPRAALHLHLCHLSCSLIQIDKVRLRAQLAQFIFIMLSMLSPIIRLICWGLADEVFAAMSLDIVPVTRLLAPAAFIKGFSIALLVTTRVRRVE